MEPNSNRTLIVILAVAGALVLVCGGVVGLVALFMIEKEVPMTDRDREVLITAEQVAENVQGLKVEASRGRFKKARRMDGSVEVSYDYESDELVVMSSVTVDRNESDARATFVGYEGGMKIGLSFQGKDAPKLEAADPLWHWGDASRCYLLVRDGNRVGNYLVARKGKRVFVLVLVGVWYGDRAALEDLLGSVLQRVEGYQP